jgi:hypothetical protein
LKVGRDNGVVNQRLSRFSTDYEAQDKHHCAGNTNWLNYRGPVFKETSRSSSSNINRRGFRAGQTMIGSPVAGLTPNDRAGMGNEQITRPAFMSPKIRSRDVLDFARLQAMDIEQYGAKVQLSSKNISQLTEVKIPDPLDSKWLEEKARLTVIYTTAGMTKEQIAEEMEINKPLGREQRTKSKTVNLSQSNLTTGQKIDEIKEEVDAGRAESRIQQARIAGELALVFSKVNTMETLTQRQIRNLGLVLARVALPTTHAEFGIVPRIVDINYYNANSGLINLFLLANVEHSKVLGVSEEKNISLDNPVFNFNVNAEGLPPMKLRSMVQSMSRRGNRFYLDLNRRRTINKTQMRQIATSIGGFDSPLVSVDPNLA